MTDQPRTIVITGASDGIGAAAARRLHADGHRVVIVGRDPVKTSRVAAELDTTFHVCDFVRLDDVSRLATELSAAHPHIDVLANNAGGLRDSYELTEDGFERTLQVNYLAPYLLTRLLLGNLLAARGSVIWTSSAAARAVRTIDPDTLGEPTPEARYQPLRVYGQAKLAGLFAMTELHGRFGGRGLATVAFHPGFVGSNFSADSQGLVGWFYRSPAKAALTASPERGADQLVTFASGTDWTPGVYYERGRPARRQHPALANVALSRAVWSRTEELLAAHVA